MYATSRLQRAALGRAKQIGALYDVRTDNFLDDSLFRCKLGADAVNETDLGDTSIELVITDSVEEKFNKFDVEPELQASVLAGLVTLGGSGSYLVEDKKSSKVVKMSLVYKTKRVSEGFELRHHRDLVDTDLFAQQGNLLATHVVVGIEWGAACSITCECENAENKNDATVKGALKAELEKLKGLISAKGAITRDVNENSEQANMKFSFKCKSDVSSQEDLPDTFEGALKLAKSLPSLIQKTNNGKGVPLVYTLKPLSEVVKICNLSISIGITFSLLKEATISATAQAVESITKKTQCLYDIQKLFDSFRNYVTDEKLETVDKYLNEISLHSKMFRSELQELIVKIRRCEAELTVLDKFLHETASVVKYRNYIRELQADLIKIDFIKDCIKRGIVYVGKHDLLLTDDAQIVYIFYKPLVRSTRADEVQQFFLQLHKVTFNPGNMAFKVVDEAVCPGIWKKSNTEEGAVVVYEDGVKTCADLYGKEKNDRELCLVKFESPSLRRSLPEEKARVQIRCPKYMRGQCSESPVTWHCAKCRDVVELGLHTLNFYCRCGESAPSMSVFRCNRDVHGFQYSRYPDDDLSDELQSLKSANELTPASQRKSKDDNSLAKNTGNPAPKSKEEFHSCLIKLPDAIPLAYAPNEKALVKLRCPNSFSGSRKCTDRQLVWKCAECRCRVEYGLSTEMFYCRCGESIPSSSLFRCSDIAHGPDFVSYPDGILCEEISTLRPLKEKVVLLLSEAGIDKSTWINSFFNYLAYPEWEMAMQEQLYSPAPSSFTYMANGETLDEIKISNDSHGDFFEVEEIGNVTSYAFQINGHKIKIVVPLNIKGTKALHRNSLITGSIVDCLYKYEEIHAIIILLKEERPLRAIFRSSMLEMLKCFHRLALNNILFCYSNVRTPFSLSSESFNDLVDVLREQATGLNITSENCFCLDYAPFRGLAHFNNSAKCSEKDPGIYSCSWRTAAAEVNRLLDRVDEMTPHKVTESILVNEVRTVADALAESILEAKTIQHQFSSDVSQAQTNIEMKTMTQALVKFASCLGNFAIVPYNDMAGEYLCMTVIDGDNVTNIQSKMDDQIKELSWAYEKAKMILESAKSGKCEMDSPTDLLQFKTQLISLRDYGRAFELAFARAPMLCNQI